MIYIIGPGHGGPALVAHAYLEGTYSEFYPNISQDEEGMTRLFKQFSFPGGIPSHVAPETPGSIHEGGELGYALSHAFGAAFDNPDLMVACIVGDGEAETGVFGSIRDVLLEQDYYMHMADLTAYAQTQVKLGSLYQDADSWTRKAIINVGYSGKFSSDRTISEYVSDIWKVKAVPAK